jgi:hypothetical protein
VVRVSLVSIRVHPKGDDTPLKLVTSDKLCGCKIKMTINREKIAHQLKAITTIPNVIWNDSIKW